MDNNKDISYIVFEGEMARAERHIKRLWIALIVTILLFAAEFIAEEKDMSVRQIKNIVYKCEQRLFK